MAAPKQTTTTRLFGLNLEHNGVVTAHSQDFVDMKSVYQLDNYGSIPAFGYCKRLHKSDRQAALTLDAAFEYHFSEIERKIQEVEGELKRLKQKKKAFQKAQQEHTFGNLAIRHHDGSGS